MSGKVELEKLPRTVLEKAVMLRDPVRLIFVRLCCRGPSTTVELAKEMGHARAYVNMRLVQLESMGLVSRKYEGKKAVFEVIL